MPKPRKTTQKQTGTTSKFPNRTQNDEDSDGSSDLEPFTQEYLDELLQRAKEAASDKQTDNTYQGREEEIIMLGQEEEELPPMPSLLAPKSLPRPYFLEQDDKSKIPTLSQDVIIEDENLASISTSEPPPLPPQPTLDKQGKPLTKRQALELKKKSAKPGYFELPTPDDAERARIHREAEAMRLRNAMDPKRFYRKEASTSLKKMPKQIALGTILPTTTPFGTASTDNLTRAERKRSIVEELVDDSEAKRYAKKKFQELQVVHGERGRDTWNRRQLARKRQW